MADESTITSVNDLPITLELNVNKVNVILRSLGKHPFDEINNLISEIKQQGDFQVQLWTEKLEEFERQTREQIQEEIVENNEDVTPELDTEIV